jgi:hypothetical protein
MQSMLLQQKVLRGSPHSYLGLCGMVVRRLRSNVYIAFLTLSSSHVKLGKCDVSFHVLNPNLMSV